MQIFTCPFCGERNETEFHFVGEAGKVRPATSGEISESEWARYLYAQRNDLGSTREIWIHLPCQELFLMERDSMTMGVRGTRKLRKENG